MRQVVFRGVCEVEVVEAPKPVPAPGEVLIDVDACGVCGSDVFAYTGHLDIRRPGTVMGHEASGVVAAVGDGVDARRVGEHVAVNPVVACGTCDFCRAGQDNLCRTRGLYGCVLPLEGAYAHHVAVRAENAIPLPAGVALELGALAEPLSVGHHAAGIAARLGEPRRVAIAGGGPIGLAVALSLRARGTDEIVVSEPLASRGKLLRRMGFKIVEPSALERLPEFDVVVDAVGISATLSSAIRVVRPQGLVVFVGLGQDELTVPGHPIETGERRIAGSAAYTAADFRAVVGALPGLDVAPMIESHVRFDEMTAVFAGYAARSRTALKTLLRPGA